MVETLGVPKKDLFVGDGRERANVRIVMKEKKGFD